MGCYSGRKVMGVLVGFFLKEAPRRYQGIALCAWLHSEHLLLARFFAHSIDSIVMKLYFTYDLRGQLHGEVLRLHGEFSTQTGMEISARAKIQKNLM